MKKLLVLLTVLAMLFMFSMPAMAIFDFPGCQNCNQVSVDVDAGASLVNSMLGSFKNGVLGGGYSLASVDAEALAEATAKDYYTYDPIWHEGYDKEVFDHYEYSGGEEGGAGWYQKQHPWWKKTVKWFDSHPQPQYRNEWLFLGAEREAIYVTIHVPGYWEPHWTFHNGEGEAHAFIKVFQKTPKVCIITTGIKATGLSFTIVHTKAELTALGFAWASGSPDCPQTAIIDLSGELAAVAYGNSLTLHPNGMSFAAAHAEGSTVAEFEGYKSEVNDGFAAVGLFGKVSAEQSVFASSYVSEDGTTASNFAMVKGGSASAKGDLELAGIKSSGMVTQSGQATNGAGAFASGTSTASFSNAVGSVFSSRCGSIGNGAGMAVVSGYNNVTTTPAGVSVTSSQSGYATTGNVGGQPN